MSHAIHADYTFNQDQFITAQNYHVRFTGRKMRWLRWAFLGITIATVVSVIVIHGNINPMMLVVLGVGYIGVVAAEVMQHPKMIARAIRKRFEQGIYQAQRVSFTIKDENITTQTDGKYEKQMTWHEFYKIVETPDGFLMYLNKQIFLWLPLDSIRPTDAEESLKEIWKSNKLECARV